MNSKNIFPILNNFKLRLYFKLHLKNALVSLPTHQISTLKFLTISSEIKTNDKIICNFTLLHTGERNKKELKNVAVNSAIYWIWSRYDSANILWKCSQQWKETTQKNHNPTDNCMLREFFFQTNHIPSYPLSNKLTIKQEIMAEERKRTWMGVKMNSMPESVSISLPLSGRININITLYVIGNRFSFKHL